MQRRVCLEIFGITAVTALFSRLAAPTATPKQAPAGLPEGWNVCGVQPNLSRTQVESLLGPPDYSGSLKVVDNRKGTYVEYGSTKPTWNGHPTIVYDEDGTVISVVGPSASKEGRELFRCGDSERIVLDSLGSNTPGEKDPIQGHLSRKMPEGDLELSFSNGTLTRMVFCRRK